jgi:hypothetical protein
MNKCCKGRTTAYCPDCGANLITRESDELLHYLRSALRYSETNLQQAQADLETEKKNDAGAAAWAQCVVNRKQATVDRWTARLHIATAMAEVYARVAKGGDGEEG